MGVKDLWQVLGPVCQRKPLWELQDKVIAVDLSCWVCDSQNVAEFSSQPNTYLRNLFFRTSALLLLGAIPVFVLEGTAPEMKAAVMEQRNAVRGFTQTQKNGTEPPKKKKRSQLKSIQKKCCKMLACLGVKFIQSDEEAEALCAALNEHGLVAGCISQDSDCFLYGAETVYRNFTSTPTGNNGGPGFSVDVYTMTSVQACLGLTRNKLISLSLLCGCDYLQKGVAGVGKESALKFLSSVDDSEILDRLRDWRENDYFHQLELERSVGGCEKCGHIGKERVHSKDGCKDCNLDKGCRENYNPKSLQQMDSEKRKTVIVELTIRKKALLDPDFPSEQIIEEFLRPNISVPAKLDTKWDQPNISEFIRFAVHFLNWDEVYAFNKFLPILTRWVLLEMGNTSKDQDSCPVFPEEIKKSRILRGIASYEIKWTDSTGLFDSLAKSAQDSQVNTDDMFCTIEPKVLVEKAYPDLVTKYNNDIEEAKKAKRKGKSKSQKGSDKTATNKGKKGQKRLLKDTDDKTQLSLSPFLTQREKAKPPLLNISLEDKFETSLNLDDDQDYGEADLSAVVMGIVGKEAYFRDSSAQSPQQEATSQESALSECSDQEYETNIPLIERIKMKKGLATSQSVNSSPEIKRVKKNLCEPYSPLSDKPSSDVPCPNRRTSIFQSKAALRFSASFQTFSGKDSTPNPHSLSSDEGSEDSRFDCGFSRFLNCDDE